MKCLMMNLQKVQYVLWFVLLINPVFSLDTKSSGNATVHPESKGSEASQPRLSDTKTVKNERLLRETLEDHKQLRREINELQSELDRVERAADIVHDKMNTAFNSLNRVLRKSNSNATNITSETPPEKNKRSASDHSKSVQKNEKTYVGSEHKQQTKRDTIHQTPKVETKEPGQIKNVTKRNATHDKAKGETVKAVKEHHEHATKVTKRSDTSQVAKVLTDVGLVKKIREAVKTEKAATDPTTPGKLKRRKRSAKHESKSGHGAHCKDCSHQPKSSSNSPGV